MSRPFRLRAEHAPESAVQDAILRYLRFERRVAWAHRFNTGAHVIEDAAGRRYVRYAFPGCSDILGQLVNGAFLAIECKTARGRARPEQIAFLAQVEASGGLAILARSIDDVRDALDAFEIAESPRSPQPQPRGVHDAC
jgi:hypothetical protein